MHLQNGLQLQGISRDRWACGFFGGFLSQAPGLVEGEGLRELRRGWGRGAGTAFEVIGPAAVLLNNKRERRTERRREGWEEGREEEPGEGVRREGGEVTAQPVCVITQRAESRASWGEQTSLKGGQRESAAPWALLSHRPSSPFHSFLPGFSLSLSLPLTYPLKTPIS